MVSLKLKCSSRAFLCHREGLLENGECDGFAKDETSFSYCLSRIDRCEYWGSWTKLPKFEASVCLKVWFIDLWGIERIHSCFHIAWKLKFPYKRVKIDIVLWSHKCTFTCSGKLKCYHWLNIKELRNLHLSQCQYQFESLKYLNIQYCLGYRNGFLAMLGRDFPQLHEIDLNGCREYLVMVFFLFWREVK